MTTDRFWCVLILLVGSSSAAVADVPERMYATDVYEVATASDPRITRDGRRVAYVRESADRATDARYSTVSVVDLRTGIDSPLTSGRRSDSLPRWSPTGATLAYQRRAASGYELIFHAIDDGSERVAAAYDAPLIALEWSPDGRRLAGIRQYSEQLQVPWSAPAGAQVQPVARVATRVDFQGPADPFRRPSGLEALVFDVGPDRAVPRPAVRFSLDAFPPRGPAVEWSRDGAALIVSANPSSEFWRNIWRHRLYEIRIDSGEVRALTAEGGSDFAVVVSPDGARLGFISDPQPKDQWYFRAELTVADRSGARPRSLSTALDRPFMQVAWLGDTKLVASFVDRGVAKIGAFGLDGTYAELTDRLAGRASAYSARGSFSVAANGTVAFTYASDTQSSEVAVVRAGQPVRVVTALNAAYESTRRFGAVTPLNFESADGVKIDAWVVRPPDFRKGTRYPLVVALHGGVSSDYGPRFDTGFQLLAAHGFIVVYPNYRGSGSYGAAFANRADGEFPHGSELDAVGALDAMLATGEVDPSQTYVMGGSAGGTLTAWTIGRTNRFTAAAVLYPVIDWGTYYVTSISYMRPFLFKEPVWKDSASYVRRSPLSIVGEVQTPTTVLVGDLDRITPPDQAVAYYIALRQRGVDAQLVTFPDEPHGLERFPSHEAQVSIALIEWFRAHGARVDAPRLQPASGATRAP
jgi:dipeptidyl aminopeptidase/acylaminoacyl peptidase